VGVINRLTILNNKGGEYGKKIEEES